MKSTDGIFLALPEATGDGITLAVKDLFDTAGLTTTYGSPIFAEHVPVETAEAVRRLEAAGYTNVGKTNLHEFAYGVTSMNPHFGWVPNPLAPGRIAGGSSGGSAAALAAGLADAALGSDTGGSIRIPAAFCGIVGFKPTFGLVPLDGCWPLAPSYDHAGPMARTVADCAAMMNALAGVCTQPVELGDLRIAVAWTDEAQPGIRARVEEAAALFPHSEPISFPHAQGHLPVFMREVAEVHEALFADHADEYGDDVAWKLRELCFKVTDAELAEAERVARVLPRTGHGAARGIRPPAHADAGIRRADLRAGGRRFVPDPDHAVHESVQRPRLARPRAAVRPRRARPAGIRAAGGPSGRGRARPGGRIGARGSSTGLEVPKQAESQCSSPVPPPSSYSRSCSSQAQARRRVPSRRARWRHPRSSTASSCARTSRPHDTFTRTPSFAWQPVMGANRYEFQLASSRGRSGPVPLLARKTTRTPAVSLAISLPWITGTPYSLFARVRALAPNGAPTPWSELFGFNMRWTNLPTPLEAAPGLIRWTPVDGATAYQVWYLEPNKIFKTQTTRRRRARVLHAPPGHQVDRHRALADPRDPRALRERPQRAARRRRTARGAPSTRRRTRRSPAARCRLCRRSPTRPRRQPHPPRIT